MGWVQAPGPVLRSESQSRVSSLSPSLDSSVDPDQGLGPSVGPSPVPAADPGLGPGPGPLPVLIPILGHRERVRFQVWVRDSIRSQVLVRVQVWVRVEVPDLETNYGSGPSPGLKFESYSEFRSGFVSRSRSRSESSLGLRGGTSSKFGFGTGCQSRSRSKSSSDLGFGYRYQVLGPELGYRSRFGFGVESRVLIAVLRPKFQTQLEGPCLGFKFPIYVLVLGLGLGLGSSLGSGLGPGHGTTLGPSLDSGLGLAPSPSLGLGLGPRSQSKSRFGSSCESRSQFEFRSQVQSPGLGPCPGLGFRPSWVQGSGLSSGVGLGRSLSSNLSLCLCVNPGLGPGLSTGLGKGQSTGLGPRSKHGLRVRSKPQATGPESRPRSGSRFGVGSESQFLGLGPPFRFRVQVLLLSCGMSLGPGLALGLSLCLGPDPGPILVWVPSPTSRSGSNSRPSLGVGSGPGSGAGPVPGSRSGYGSGPCLSWGLGPGLGPASGSGLSPRSRHRLRVMSNPWVLDSRSWVPTWVLSPGLGQVYMSSAGDTQERLSRNQAPQVAPPASPKPTTEDLINAMLADSQQFKQETQAAIKSLENQVGQLSESCNRMQSQLFNQLPSQPEKNPKENASAVTLRSGKHYDPPIIPKPKPAYGLVIPGDSYIIAMEDEGNPNPTITLFGRTFLLTVSC
ncbi:hypothetical protein G4B88_010148 [Cannabis sativa]|uniref:Uncharacterized protein n=1 Tax=Cannabis sativa TaxID=3483 RepID=A0A7J6DYD4_CANSA|nr:hypothetical protein G4B88_010148 [Cannabis sativa]